MLCWVPSGGVTGGSPAPAVAGPSPRSGHTLTTLAGGETHVLFGGAGRGAGSKASYLCDAHIARVTPANGGVTWQALATTGDAPPPRARHTAVALDERRLLVWGGTDQKQQFNDCWVLDVQTASWKAVEVAGTAPQPRAHHTACRLGDRLFVFGGYGGSGTALGDLWVLHLGPEVLRWEEVAAGGAAPQPRFDHAAAIFPCTANSSTPDRLIILGGRDSSQNFSDMHVLDLESMSWLQDHGMPPLGGEMVCNHLCSGVESVPYHKIFAGFGKQGTLQHIDTIQVLDAGAKQWTSPELAAGQRPCGREDTAWAWHAKTFSLLMFGGFARRWLGDTWRADVSSIIGPGYACLGISPATGPVAGGTEVTITGLRFREGIRVRLRSARGDIVVDGSCASSEAVHFKTPQHEQNGALPCEVAVSVAGGGWTVNHLKFQYFSNMLASACVAFGPGVLPQVSCGIEMPFLLVAKDTSNHRRSSGGDVFEIAVESEAGVVVGSSRIVDRGNGLYECFYRAPAPGRYKICVRGSQPGIEGCTAHIRGSPFSVECCDPWQQRQLAGTAPAKRAGAVLAPVGGDLVLFGGDRSPAAVCHHAPQREGEAAVAEAWQWSAVGDADRPAARKAHSWAVTGGGKQLVVSGGQALEGDPSDLQDVRLLINSSLNGCSGSAASSPSWHWQPEGPAIQLHQRPEGGQQVPTERSGHCLVALGSVLLAFGGEHQGQLLQELCLLDTSAQAPQAWVEPAVEGVLPCARKGAAAAAAGDDFAVVFGGCAVDEQGEGVLLNDLFLIEMQSQTHVRCGQQQTCGEVPPPRAGALLQELSSGRLLLYGGVGPGGKPLGDAWLLDVATLTFECLYDGEGQAAAPAALHDGKLVCLAASPGSSRLDLLRSIDLHQAREAVSFRTKMKAEVVAAAKELEGWVAKQQTGLDLAAKAETTDTLLKVMDALYLVRSKRRHTDLLFDQLKEACQQLAIEHRFKDAAHTNRQLDELRHRWEAVKKEAPQVRASTKTAQEAECERVKADIQRFSTAVAQYTGTVYTSRGFFAWATGVETATADCDKTFKDLEAMHAEYARIHALSKLFDCSELLEQTGATIKATDSELQALSALWKLAATSEARLAQWNQTLFAEVAVAELEAGAKALLKEVKALPAAIKEQDCFKGLDLLVKNYMAAVPLIGDLRSPAMRPRHWEALQQATKVHFVMGADFRVEDLLKLQLHKYSEDVAEIVDRAQKEEKMETALVKLQETWARVAFAFQPHRGSSEVSTVKMEEDDFAALEDNQVLVQGMMASRFVAAFRDEVQAWNKKLNAVADVVQLMAEIQRSWAYLESLFIQSDEVRRELPEATQRFAGIDAAVRAVLLEMAATRNCVDCCTKEGLLKHLEVQQGQLELCEKALADFMESKRRAFPRFYFVSSSDLLEILSNGNNPARVMPHMSKCFQAIDKLRLDTDKPAAGQRPKALGMESCVGVEYVPFTTPLALDGKVEVYMGGVVDKMRSELRSVMGQSVRDYPSKPRDKWMVDWPSQVALMVNQMYWCLAVEEAFEKMARGNQQAMKAYNDLQVRQLTRLIEITCTELSKADRQKVMNHITIDAHSRDVVANIVETAAADGDCFAWQSQLRTYWDSEISDCRVRICDASFPYGHEYLGNGPRLVITPLTDRIYVTATQAMWLSLGTAPAGPAGTGKTETTKDLAAQLGKACYVFNCAPEMDYHTLGNIFKGLAASGLPPKLALRLQASDWPVTHICTLLGTDAVPLPRAPSPPCTLVPEVLSVCSVQYKCVTDAQRRKAALPGRGLEYVDARGAKQAAVQGFTFVAADGVEMPLEEGTSVFITMNPGYIGRAELPESLKALFRPITVVVPDRQLIMENMLMAEGFVTAKALAKKFAALYYLLEDLLSPQKHYDWGLRAIKSVLVVAGGLLRSAAGQDETDVLFRALRDFNLPKILAQDLVVFNGLLADIFPATDPPRQRDPAFEDVIKSTAIEMGLEPDEEFVHQVVALSELLAIRHCVFLMGPSGCGRSEVIRVLAKAMSAGCSAPSNPYLQANNRKKVVVRDLNPKSITTQELYGYVNMATREWRDGLLSCTLRELANVPDDNPKWIVLDGDLDANWIESANSLMDDNKLLTLPSNERIRLLPHMKLIFEIRDLRYATPATATRAGILYISEGRQWLSMVESWLRRVARAYAEKARWSDPEVPVGLLRELFAKYVPPTVFEMRKTFSHIVPLGPMNFVGTLCSIIEGLLRPENLPAKADPALFEMAFVFACVWAFGGALCEKDGVKYRQAFDKWWKSTWSAVRFPAKGTVYDYYVNFRASKFSPWADLVQPVDFDGSVPMSQVFVPTPETVSLRYFLDMMLALRKPIMFVGGSGVGKTQLVKGKLQGLGEEQAALSISLNYFTDVASFQKILESQLEKKAGSSHAPPANRQQIYFVDDLNMPRLDAYETAMPISLMRQHLGYGHWYDRTKLSLKTISGTQYVACMNPTAGSFVVDPRLQRLFVTLAVESPGVDSLMQIYGTFLSSHLKKFSPEVQELGTKLLQAALALHDKVIGTFRKTAVNFHYEFTVRHLAQVFQGLLSSTPEHYNSDPSKLIRLWLHESERTYADRLVSAADLAQFSKLILVVAKKYFNLPDLEEYYRAKDPKPLLFCHFANGRGGSEYGEVCDAASWKRLQRTLNEGLGEYNETNAVMDLVLFDDAIKHVCRISRIISNPGGHALLVGVGGSGKQSLARLAAHMCGYACDTIVISGTYTLASFRDDLLRMYKRAGLKGVVVVGVVVVGVVVVGVVVVGVVVEGVVVEGVVVVGVVVVGVVVVGVVVVGVVVVGVVVVGVVVVGVVVVGVVVVGVVVVGVVVVGVVGVVVVGVVVVGVVVVGVVVVGVVGVVVVGVVGMAVRWNTPAEMQVAHILGRIAAGDDEGVLFLLTDSQIVDEKMLVYVNDLLSSGDIPDLFAPEDREEIIGAMRGEAKARGLPDTNDNCWRLFIQRVVRNLHVCFTCSPVGDAFRVRSQRFLATVNSTTIDWFHPWPEASLHSVAGKFLDDLEVESEEVRKAVVEFMPASFSSVGATARKYLGEERRRVYSTPKTFLELIKLYRSLLASKRQEVQVSIERLSTGLSKLTKTQKDVDVLVEQARVMAVEVEEKVAAASRFAEEVGVEKEKVNAENAAAQVEADSCATIAREVTKLQARCEVELAAAEPLVAQAQEALDTLTKKDLGELKALRNPPAGVDDITAVVLCLLENVPRDKSWGAASKMMSQVDQFMARLKGFKPLIDAGEVPQKNVDACRTYLDLPHFNKETMSNKSKAAAGLCSWAINIVRYYDVWSTVEPKRQELAQANAKLQEANEKLAAVRAKVAALNAQLEALEQQYAAAAAERDAALAQSEACQRRLDLANRLIAALASEGGRWAATVEQLRGDYRVLTGDMLLAAAFISYAGPFSSKFRELLVADWLKFLRERGVPMSPGLSDPLKCLVDDAVVAGWVREGLPSDPTSVQNGTILTNSERWPLMLDPQLQGVAWVKERLAKKGLVCLRMGAPDMLRVLERAISEGHTVLFENIGESIDAVLTPVITRATFKKGRALYLKLGDKEVEYNRAFRCILHTKLSNPHYAPEVQAETTLINFTVTEGGLEDQLLALVVNKEREDLEEAKSQLIVQNSEFVIKLKQLEDGLLEKLSTAQGDLTENEALIIQLEESKALADEISEKVVEARETEIKINEARNVYRGVAARGAMLFFMLNSLGKMHAFYQYSLGAFVDVFERGIDVAPGGKRKPPHGSGGEGHRRTSLLELTQRRQTGQPLGFEAAMENARRSTMGGGRGERGISLAGTHPELGPEDSDAPLASTRQSVLGEATLKHAKERVSSMGGPRRTSQLHASESQRTTHGGGPRFPGHVLGPAAAEEEAQELTPEQLVARLEALLQSCTYTVFSYTQRGLFDRDKLTFTALLTTQILLKSGSIDARELEHLCRWPRAAAPPPPSDELGQWMSEASMAALAPLAQLPAFGGLLKDLEKRADEWGQWAAGDSPETDPMPGEWSKLSDFRRLLILRALKPDRMPAALSALCERVMGAAYVNQEPFSAKALLAESSHATPIFFVLFPGYSPSAQIEAYARTAGRTAERGNFQIISLGQGQEGPAERVLDKYMKEGGWVFLDNTHLMSGWIPTLERKLEAAAEGAHRDFRCFFSAEPIAGAPHAAIMPESLLQTAIRVSNEPPSDIKSNMRRAWAAFSPYFFQRASSEPKRRALRGIIFGLSFFHSLLLGRKKFGTGIGGSAAGGGGLGYCRAYSFNQGDLATCGDVILNYVEASKGAGVPWQDLRYLLGQVFYGGHVVDDYDRRLLSTYLDAIIRQELLPQATDPALAAADEAEAAAEAEAAGEEEEEEEEGAGEDGEPRRRRWRPTALELAPGFYAPPPTDYESMRQYIETLPADSPALYAMHDNAQLSLLNSQTDALFQTILDVGGVGGGAAVAAASAATAASAASAAGSGEAAVRARLADLLGRLPAPLVLLEIEARVKEKTPFVVVALQETERMNGLLAEMRRSMEELQLGLDGALNMSPAMEQLLAALGGGRVPSSWMACMSTRIQEVYMLTAWYADVLARHKQLVVWTSGDITPPHSIWLPGLFNPKACLTAVMQAHARQCRLPLDVMRFLVEVTAFSSPAQLPPGRLPDGCVYIHGLTLEGARWDAKDGCLRDSLPNQLRQALPVLLVRPVTAEVYAEALAAGDLYLCPLYTNGQRANVYSPLVSTFTLKTLEPASKWVLASTALLLQDDLA
ncbi:hypothetical protein D9Q98_005734 [Chlorella vulgaris]|uniref:AAA+ ATPase domain-containing protein n=1 Tax=Chlorella vulgaris TaxID=3077 RepID=A0A9D4TMF7_CHLVU|nr:hypothetical protein D9Q98_005734 [Chlorella vulgaris]